MITFNEHIQILLKESRLKNIEEVQKNTNSKEISSKIENYCDKYDSLFSKQNIVEEIRTNKLVASFFAKDPLKQNLVENECEKWIKSKKLPQAGPQAIRFKNDGNLTNKKVQMLQSQRIF